MKSLKISQKLMLGIIAQLLFIVLLIFFIFSSRGKLDKVSESTQNKTKQVEKVKVLTSLSKEFIVNNVSFEEVALAFTAKSEEQLGDEVQLLSKTIWEKLQIISSLKTQNDSIEFQALELIHKSIEQSNSYIYLMSETLADADKRKKVSTIERLVIGGANKNTNNNYMLEVLFLRMKEDSSYKVQLINSLEEAIRQAKGDIEKLKNTPFAQLPILAQQANEENLNLTMKYISNVDSVSHLADEIILLADKSYKHLNEENLSSMNQGFLDIKGLLRNVFIILLIISLGLVSMNFYTSKEIGFIFKKINADLSEISNGNLNATGALKFELRKDELGDLSRSVIKLIHNFKNIIGLIRSGADNISLSSQNVSEVSQQISEGVSEQASSAEEISTSMEQMSANIQQNTDNAMTTREISTSSSISIEKVALASEDSLMAVSDIYAKINVVVEIAEKTDLLAINAAVEAARAGEQGRGFAVVASEVRKLAERSQIAASEIVALANKGMRMTEESTSMLNSIVPDIKKTSGLIDEIALASREQDTGANQVNVAIQQLSTVTQRNAAVADNMANSSKELANQAIELEEVTRHFNIS